MRIERITREYPAKRTLPYVLLTASTIGDTCVVRDQYRIATNLESTHGQTSMASPAKAIAIFPCMHYAPIVDSLTFQ